MSNIEKAVVVADHLETEVMTANSYSGPPNPHEYVRALDAEGLLMPDLPRGKPIFTPDVLEWEIPRDSVVWTAPGGRIMIQRVEPGELTPDEARKLALSILAAANYAESE